jgi:hypothetical protein
MSHRDHSRRGLTELLRRLLAQVESHDRRDDLALLRAMHAVPPEERRALVAHLRALARRLRDQRTPAEHLRPPLRRGRSQEPPPRA